MCCMKHAYYAFEFFVCDTTRACFCPMASFNHNGFDDFDQALWSRPYYSYLCVCVDRQVIQHFDSKSEHFIGGSNGNQRDIKLTNKLSIDDLSLKAAQVFVASQYTLFNMSWCFYPFDSSTPHSYSFA